MKKVKSKLAELKLRKAGQEQLFDFRLSKPGDKTATYTDYDGSLINIPANDQQGFYDFEGKVKLVVDLALGKHPTLSKRFPVPNKGYIIAPKWEDNIQTVILEKLKAFIPRCYLKGGSWEKAWSEGHRRLSYANRFNDSLPIPRTGMSWAASTSITSGSMSMDPSRIGWSYLPV
jgi:hypothetical protein